MRSGLCLLAILGGAGTCCQAEEIAPFRLTGVDGEVSLRYIQDDLATAGTGATRQSQSGLRNEISLMTHSYIYHPNLLSLDIGGGPILHHDSYTGPGGDSTVARGMLYNLSARATFLRDKPYRGGLFFEHINPTVSVAPGQVLTQENTRYGIDFSLLAPVTPVPLHASLVHSHFQGRGAERSVDDTLDQFYLNASRSYGALGSSQLQVQATRQASTSGSLGLPIQASTSATHAVNLDTRLEFGTDRQYSVNNLVSFGTQSYALGQGALPAMKDARFVLDGRARNSATLSSHALLSVGNNSQGALDATSKSAAGGINYRPLAGLDTTLGAHADDTTTRQFTLRVRGIDGSVRLERALPIGTGQISYGLRYDERAQRAATPRSDVIGERLALTGTGYAGLGHSRVVAGSIVINNATRTQTFVEGIDYSVLVVGAETRLQRLIGGRILDGEPLLADYGWDTGGSYAYGELAQALGLDWNIANYANVFFRHARVSPSLFDGTPTFPLNAVSSNTVGARVDVPLRLGIALTVGGNAEFEHRQETVAPYRRASANLYVQTDEPLPGLGQFRASTRRTRIDYRNGAAAVDVLGYDMRYWTRRWFGIDLTAAWNYERDSSGLVPHRHTDWSLGAQWRERKFTLTTSLIRASDVQNGTTRSRTLFQFLARREI